MKGWNLRYGRTIVGDLIDLKFMKKILHNIKVLVNNEVVKHVLVEYWS